MSADIQILPVVHALTGCDTTRKAGTKVAALKTANACGYEYLCFFGKHELTYVMIYNAAQFLLRYILNWKARFIWRFKMWRLKQKLQEFDLEKFLATSSTIKQHILRASLQCHLRLHAPFIEDILIDTLQYGHSLNEDDSLIINSSRFSITLYLLKMCKIRFPMPYQANCLQPILQMQCETILPIFFKLLMNYHARSVHIRYFLLILSKNLYIYLGKR